MENQLAIIREIAAIGAKQDLMLESLKTLEATLTTNYVPRTELEQRQANLINRIEKVEKEQANLREGHHKWLPYIVAIIVGVPGFVALFR